MSRLAPLRPDFVSVTYGAGGSSQARSCGAVRSVARTGLATAAHLTCAGASRDEVDAVITEFRAMGIRRFVALRGDPEDGVGKPYRPHPGGYRDTAHLVRALKDAGADDVSVSAYPERHPHSADWEVEIDVLKRKVDAGADRAITQFFFDNDLFESYVERVRRAGISIPVVPGIMPIHRFASICGFAARCGTSVPAGLHRRFADLDDRSQTHALVAAAVAAEQMSDLVRARHRHVPHLHAEPAGTDRGGVPVLRHRPRGGARGRLRQAARAPFAAQLIRLRYGRGRLR